MLAIYGDVKTDEVKAAVEKAFGKLETRERRRLAGEPFDRSRHPPARRRRSQARQETRDKKQAVLVVGFPGTTMVDDDRYALELIQESCSDLGSRLFLRIREQLGLAYYVGAQNLAGLVPGYFAFYTGTEPAKVALVEKELLKEAELLRTEGLTAEELKRAKAKIIGQKKIARQDLGHLASTHRPRRTLRPRLPARGTGRRQIRSRHAGTNQGRRAKISQAGCAGGRRGEAGKTGLKKRSGTRCPKPRGGGGGCTARTMLNQPRPGA